MVLVVHKNCSKAIVKKSIMFKQTLFWKMCVFIPYFQKNEPLLLIQSLVLYVLSPVNKYHGYVISYSSWKQMSFDLSYSV